MMFTTENLVDLLKNRNKLKEELSKLQDAMRKCSYNFDEERKVIFEKIIKSDLSGEVITDADKNSIHSNFLYFLNKKRSSYEYDAIRICSDINNAHFGITNETCILNTFSVPIFKTQEDYKAAFDIVYEKFNDLSYYK